MVRPAKRIEKKEEDKNNARKTKSQTKDTLIKL